MSEPAYSMRLDHGCFVVYTTHFSQWTLDECVETLELIALVARRIERRKAQIEAAKVEADYQI